MLAQMLAELLLLKSFVYSKLDVFLSWNSLVNGYARNRDVELALKVFDEMSSRDAFTWTALVDGLCKCGKFEVARVIFDQIPDKSLVT
ncbi:hypothetical protein RYX36_005402 [Vicia faba]